MKDDDIRLQCGCCKRETNTNRSFYRKPQIYNWDGVVRKCTRLEHIEIPFTAVSFANFFFEIL